jgi:hypothetical protein
MTNDQCLRPSSFVLPSFVTRSPTAQCVPVHGIDFRWINSIESSQTMRLDSIFLLIGDPQAEI